METTIIEEQACPYCGHMLDTHNAVKGIPEPGDISICFYCGEIMIFSEYLSLLKCGDKILESRFDEIREEALRIQKEIKSKL